MKPDQNRFTLVGAGYQPTPATPVRRRVRRLPLVSLAVLAIILLGCLFAGLMTSNDPTYLDLKNSNQPPNHQFLFGTDPMGRDIFAMIWYGGRVSLLIGLLSALISTVIAVIYGSASGISPQPADRLLMRITEMLLSIPSVLVILFVQAVIGQSNPISIALTIGVTSWMGIAKVVRSEVRQLKNSTYLKAAKTMHAGFFYLVFRHLLPNLVPSIMFMVVTNIATAIATESTLSFLGIGLPIETISWGSMLSQADRALMSGSWWLIVIPGLFLVVTLICITNIGNYIRKEGNQTCTNL